MLVLPGQEVHVSPGLLFQLEASSRRAQFLLHSLDVLFQRLYFRGFNGFELLEQVAVLSEEFLVLAAFLLPLAASELLILCSELIVFPQQLVIDLLRHLQLSSEDRAAFLQRGDFTLHPPDGVLHRPEFLVSAFQVPLIVSPLLVRQRQHLVFGCVQHFQLLGGSRALFSQLFLQPHVGVLQLPIFVFECLQF
jgi:hypothetical protein